ncbi:11033_t:CDS:1 [Diversispora eburnea]|uniref:11033_t:CDS:1 n=1 Tax=Diversispora eburnea TaxID=1213867 RepID=A0A9N8UX23_9GLOM|nr:11033_t:CDS:1 [Diversispora eburnea]
MASFSTEILKLILEFFLDDIKSLLSCLVINKQFAQVTTSIIWENPWKYVEKRDEIKLLNIIISFLPDKSRKILKEHGIFIPLPSKPPLFDYVSLCRNLVYSQINLMTELITCLPEYNVSKVSAIQISDNRNDSTNLLGQSETYNFYLIKQEIYKMYVGRCQSLERLEFHDIDIPLPFFKGAERIFLNLCELHCDTSLLSGTYYRMAQICQNLERLIIEDCCYDNDGLTTLIEAQTKLKYLKIITKGSEEHGNSRYNRYSKISSAMSSQAHSLLYFEIGGSFVKGISPVTIATFENLQNLNIGFQGKYEDILKYSSFPQLRVLECHHVSNPLDILINFIERTNGLIEKISFEINNVTDFHLIRQYNQSIARYCPNIKFLTTWFTIGDAADFKYMLISCPKLEHLTIGSYENEGEYYIAKIEELVNVINEVESEMKPRLLKLWRIEFRFAWEIRNMLPLSNYLRKRREKILRSNSKKPLKMMELYFSTSFMYTLKEDEKIELIERLEHYKLEELIKNFGFSEYEKLC